MKAQHLIVQVDNQNEILYLHGDVQRDGPEGLVRLPGVVPPLSGGVGSVEEHQEGEGQQAAVEALGHCFSL